MFGGPTDEATSGRIIARARAVGINFIDTADAYNNGRSEEVVGRAIAPEQGGPHDAVGRDGARPRGLAATGKNPVFWRLEFPDLARG